MNHSNQETSRQFARTKTVLPWLLGRRGRSSAAKTEPALSQEHVSLRANIELSLKTVERTERRGKFTPMPPMKRVGMHRAGEAHPLAGLA